MSQVRAGLRGQILTPLGDGLRYLRDGVVLFDKQGRLVFVGSFRTARRRYAGPIQDVRPGVIVPGFVDAHTHYPQTRIMGRATGPLLEWLDRAVFPEESRFAQASHAARVAALFSARTIRSGTTTTAVFSSSHPRATEKLFGVLADSGLRALVGLTLMDRGCPPSLRVKTDDAMAASRRLIRRWHGHQSRLEFAVTPRFALSCSRKLLVAAGRLTKDFELAVQTHIGETRNEGAATLAAHRYASDYLDVYERAGLIGPRTLLAHAIHLSPSEWKRVGDRGASVVHCPDSNFFLGSGRMRIARANKHGIPVALGSDVAAGRSFSMRRAMAAAYDNAMCVGAPLEPEALFTMATLGGAHALGWQDRIGSLEVGKDADLAVFGLPDQVAGVDGVLAHLLFDSDEPESKMSFVRGCRLHR